MCGRVSSVITGHIVATANMDEISATDATVLRPIPVCTRGAWLWKCDICHRMESVDHSHHMLWSTDSFANVCTDCIDNVAVPSCFVAWLNCRCKDVCRCC